MIKMHDFGDAELQNVRRYQRLSYQILEDTTLQLRVGDSEESTVRKLRKAFHKAGAHNYFHVPVALFGERSAYPGDFGPFEAPHRTGITPTPAKELPRTGCRRLNRTWLKARSALNSKRF